MKKRKVFTKVAAGTLAVCMVGTTALSGNVPVNVLAADNEWQQIQDVVSRYYGEWNDAKYEGADSDLTPDTALMGNGDIGVHSGGNEKEKTFYISKGNLWDYRDVEHQMALGGYTIRRPGEEVTEEDRNISPTYKEVTCSNEDTWGHTTLGKNLAFSGEMQQIDTGYGWVSKPVVNNEPQWLQVEFENPVTVGSYELYNDGAVRASSAINNTRDFELQYSDDGIEWKTVDTVTGNTANIYEKTFDEAVTAKYFRLYITNPVQPGAIGPRARVAQLKLLKPEIKISENFAPTYKEVTCSNEDKWGFTTLGKDLAFSGEMQQIDTGYGWVSKPVVNNEPQWLQAEFENPVTLKYYELYSDGAVRPASANNNTRDFELQYSDDGIEWKTADAVTGNTANVYKKALDEAVTAKFIRVYITNPVQPGAMSPRARVAQLKLFEDGEVPETPEKPEEPAPDTYEKQDILNAQVLTDLTREDDKLSMKTFTSATDNLVVTELNLDADEAMELQVDAWVKSDIAKYPVTAAVNEDNSVTLTRQSGVAGSGAIISKAAISTTILGTEYTANAVEEGKVELNFTLQPNTPVYIVNAVEGGGRSYEKNGTAIGTAPEQLSKELLSTMKDEADIDSLYDEHEAWWKDFWSASYVDFGTEDEELNWVQKYYYGAQYILGCTSRQGEAAPGINGIWCATDAPRWENRYQLNYNYNAPFYGTSSSNRPEMLLGAFEETLKYVPEGQRRSATISEIKKIDPSYVNARLANGTMPEDGIKDGVLYSFAIGPDGISIGSDGYQKQTLSAIYCAYLGVEYYNYSADEEFLREKLYPYLKKCAAFYETWLEKDENGQYNIYAGYHEQSWGFNPTIELASVYYLFDSIVQASETLNEDAEKCELWKDIRDNLAPYYTVDCDGKNVITFAEKKRIGNAGDTYEFSDELIKRDGNITQLDTVVWGGGRINYFSDPEVLQSARDTLDLAGPLGWRHGNHFARAFIIGTEVRTGVEKVVSELVPVLQASMQKNLRVKDPYHGIEKCGTTEAINKMMIISEQGITKIFPNWYTDKDAKFANLRAKDAFVLSAEYDGTAQEAKNVSVTSEKGKTMTLVSPWAEGAHVLDSEGNVVEVTTGTVPNWEDTENMTITFDTKAGETYTVEKGLVDDGKEDADKADLAGLIDYANSQKDSEDYKYVVPVVKKAFEKALAEAIAVNEKADATQAEVDAAYDNLLDMVHMLGFTGNSESLKVLADSARGMNPDLFTEETWAVLEDALAAADAVLANENALQDEIDAARDALQAAMDGLVRVPVDKDALKKLIDKAQKYVDKIDQYTDGTAKIFTDMLAEAVATYENEDASQKDVDAAYAELQQAIFQLRLKPNKDKLEDLIKAAEKVDTSKYTDESAAVFKAALDNAKAVFADGEATKEEVKAAEKALKEAQKNLVAKADVDTEDGKDNNGNKENKDDKAPVKTGDVASVWTMLLACMAAVATAGTVVIRRKRR